MFLPFLLHGRLCVDRQAAQTRAALFAISMAALISVEAVKFDQISLGEFAYAFGVGEKFDASDALASEAL